MSDLIRRSDALDALGEEPMVWYDGEDEIAERNQWRRDKAALESLPSATCDDCIWHVCNYNKIDWDGEDGYISRRDVVNEIHKYFVEEIDKTPTEIDEDGDELYADMPTVNSLLACNKELSKKIKSLPSEEPKTGEWIPVSERLPEEYDQYLCYCEGGEFYVLWLENEPWVKRDVESERIIAWMPLPEPYKGGDDE